MMVGFAVLAENSVLKSRGKAYKPARIYLKVDVKSICQLDHFLKIRKKINRKFVFAIIQLSFAGFVVKRVLKVYTYLK